MPSPNISKNPLSSHSTSTSAKSNQPSSPSAPAKQPQNWTSKYDAYIREKARHGEDAESIRILFEVEYPSVGVSKAWIAETMKGK
jgi:hypothetical protein